jgi:hypothetical protein
LDAKPLKVQRCRVNLKLTRVCSHCEQIMLRLPMHRCTIKDLATVLAHRWRTWWRIVLP